METILILMPQQLHAYLLVFSTWRNEQRAERHSTDVVNDVVFISKYQQLIK